MLLLCQVESGFFHESDSKTVGKSIRDRVALIKWRRERTVSSTAALDRGDGVHQMQMQMQMPSHGFSADPTPIGQPLLEPEDPETDQFNRLQNLPASATSVTCRSFICLPHSAWNQSVPMFLWAHHLCLCSRQHTWQWLGFHRVFRLPQQSAECPLPVPAGAYYYDNTAGSYQKHTQPGGLSKCRFIYCSSGIMQVLYLHLHGQFASSAIYSCKTYLFYYFTISLMLFCFWFVLFK